MISTDRWSLSLEAPERGGSPCVGMAKRILREAAGPVKVCYEAGPCGYALQRIMKDLVVDCVVIDPALIPVDWRSDQDESGDAGSCRYPARRPTPKSSPRRQRRSRSGVGTSPDEGRTPGKDLNGGHGTGGKMPLARGRTLGSRELEQAHQAWMQAPVIILNEQVGIRIPSGRSRTWRIA